MRLLKIDLLILLLSVFIAGCQSTPVYNHKIFHTSADDLHIIFVKSDRVLQKCLYLNADAENSWRHQYFMYILSDKNEVIEVMQSTNQDKDTCEEQVKAIKKILQSESQVKLCIRGELKATPQDLITQNRTIRFDNLGDHTISYEPLTLDSACSSKDCVSNNGVWVNTCPGFVKH